MKIRKWIFYLVSFIICFLGCAQKEEFSYQLTDEKLIEILTDLHLSESATQHLSLSYKDSMSVIYLNQILEIHEVPADVFELDYIELKRDAEKLVSIYEKVIIRLDNLKIKKSKEGATKKGKVPKKPTKKK